MPKADFEPGRDGFHYPNAFVNVIAKLPGFGTIETGGRCGGMAYAALDYWFNGRLPIPAAQALPADGTIMADYVYRRLFDTYQVPSAINFITWTLAGDGENFFHKGVTRWTKEGEFPKLRAMIDQGKPQVLGLVKVTDLRQIGEDHQLVALRLRGRREGQPDRVRLGQPLSRRGGPADDHGQGAALDALGGERGLARVVHPGLQARASGLPAGRGGPAREGRVRHVHRGRRRQVPGPERRGAGGAGPQPAHR